MADHEEAEVDICGLRQRLRDEYAFVNKQKRDLQKEHSNIVSTGDSLLRGLWIAGQQWRNLNRLRGGSRFANECAYTSSLLDSVQFQDGYATVGFKEVKYTNFLRELRTNTEILKSVAILGDEFNVDTSAFLRVIVTSLYGSCLFPIDETSVLMIMKAIIQYHLVYSEKPLTIFKADRNSFVSLLDVLCHTSLPCRAFLILACREVVFDILLDGSLYWTIEEQELLTVMAVPEVRQKFGEPGSPGTTERIHDHMMQCWVALADAVCALFRKIKNSLVCLPDPLVWIISCFYKSSLKRGFNDGKARQMVMRFFFNQVIVPMLQRPQPFLIDTEVRAPRVAMFNLRKVVVIVQTLVSIEAGDDVTYTSLEARQFYENLDKGLLHEIVNNLVEGLPKDADVFLSDKDSMPGIARTSVLITKTDLYSLVDLLCELKHILNNLKQTQNRHWIEQLINRASLDKLLSHIEDIPSVTSSLANMSLSTQQTDLQNVLNNAFQAFNKSLQEEEVVLVISLGVSIIDCPGMLPEEKVLGMPTPEPSRKSTIKDAMLNHISDMNENSQPSDSDSNDSSSEEKLQEADGKDKPLSDDVDLADDTLLGMEYPVRPLPTTNPFAQTEDVPANSTGLDSIAQSANPFAQNTDLFSQGADPFADFDSVAPILNQNDPFTRVITRLPEHPAPIHQNLPSELVPSAIPPPGLRPQTNSRSLTPSPQNPVLPNRLSLTNNQGPLIDLGESESSVDPRSTSSPTGNTSDDYLLSSGSHSSTGSGKRFSSSASSSSDSGIKLASSISSTIAEAGYRHKRGVEGMTKEKKSGREDVRRKSLKENIQNVITNAVLSPKREKKKPKSGTLFPRRKRSKKTERLVDSNDVAMIIASVENVKTPKGICDDIMHRYAAIQNDRPHQVQSNVTVETSLNSRDEIDILKDAKNKLRLVLSNGSAPVLPSWNSRAKRLETVMLKREKVGRALLTYLKQDLADAIANEDCTMVARLHETLSTLEKLTPSRYAGVLNELQQDYLTRKPYLSYLVRAYQGLVGTRQFLEKALERVDREREICRRYLTTQCVSMFMVDHKEKLDWFVARFEKLPMADEKSEEIKNFIQRIKDALQGSPLWLSSNEQQRLEAFDAVERLVICRVYWPAVYAFGETDKFRDDVFHESVGSLCASIGEDFAVLEIKEDFQNEAPWYPAQYELYALSAYKTPKDKLKCIQRCCTTIMSLLGMSSGNAVGADAFTPVLIYVVMHANPRGLLTTIDFINSYLTETLTGEQYYCWMQFCSAIQFIKILLEENKSTLPETNGNDSSPRSRYR